MKTKAEIKPDLFAAMQRAEDARKLRLAAQASVPEWKAEREAVAEVARVYAEFNAAPDTIIP